MYSIGGGLRKVVLKYIARPPYYVGLPVRPVDVAVKTGNVPYVLYTVAACPEEFEQYNRQRSLLRDAARRGHLNMFVALHATLACIDAEIADAVLHALRRGHYNFIYWALLYGLRYITSRIFGLLATLNNLPLLQTLHAIAGSLPADGMRGAAASDSVEMLEYVKRHGAVIDVKYAEIAAYKAKRVALEWVIQQGVVLTPTVMEHGVASGNIEFVRYLRETLRCPLSPKACSTAADVRSLPILRYLRETAVNGTTARWSANTINTAISRRLTNKSLFGKSVNRDVIDYCVANGVPTNAETCMLAARAGRFDLARRYYELSPTSTTTLYCAAARMNALSFMQWLHDEQHLEIPPTAVVHAVSHMNCMRWLVENGAVLTPEVIEAAAARGKIHVIEYAVQHGIVPTPVALRRAIHQNNLAVLKYMVEHGGEVNHLLLSISTTPEIRQYLLEKYLKSI